MTPERVQIYGRRLTAQQKDERRQDNGDRKKLAHQHVSELLRSLTCERDRQRTTWRRLHSTLSFAISSDQTFHMLGVRHMMRMRIPSIIVISLPRVWSYAHQCVKQPPSPPPPSLSGRNITIT